MIPSISEGSSVDVPSDQGILVIREVDVQGDLSVGAGTTLYILGNLSVSGRLNICDELIVKGDVSAGSLHIGSADSTGSLIGQNGIESTGDIRSNGSILSENGDISARGRIQCEGAIMAKGNIEATGDIIAKRSVVSLDGAIESRNGSVISLAGEVASEMGVTAAACVHAGTTVIGPCTAGVRVATGLCLERETDENEAAIDWSDVKAPNIFCAASRGVFPAEESDIDLIQDSDEDEGHTRPRI